MSAIRAQTPASSLRPMSPPWIPRAMSMSGKSDEARACRNSWRPRTRTEAMRKLFGILTLVLAPVAGYAAENSLSWAYPVEPLPCMQCHLANGGSHPESAAIAGLSVNYIIEQVHAFRDGDRADVRTGRMVQVAKTISEADLKAAA